jgi:hypothetical protein
LLDTINYLADTTLWIDPVQAAIFPAGILCAYLIFGLQPLEMPVNIVRWTEVRSHEIILLRNYSIHRGEHWDHRDHRDHKREN